MNDGKKLHVEHLVDMTGVGTFIPDWLIRVSRLCDSECFGPTNHFGLGDNPHHMNKRLACGTPVASP